jgi:hypothetical protein
MSESSAPEIDVEKLMTEIREEGARRRAAILPEATEIKLESGSAASRAPNEPGPATASPDVPKSDERADRESSSIRQRNDPPRPSKKDKFGVDLRSFSHLQDAAFINAAYLAILKRSPDPIGEEFYVGLVRSGASRAEILGRLRFSVEGRNIGTPVAGLTSAYLADKLMRTRVVGRVFRAAYAVWTLSESNRQYRITTNEVARIGARADQRFKAIQQSTQESFQKLQSRIGLLVDERAARAIRDEGLIIRKSLTELRELIQAMDRSKAPSTEIARLRQEIEDTKPDRQELTHFKAGITAMLETKPNKEDIDGLTTRIDAADSMLNKLKYSRANAEQIDQVRAENRNLIHGAVDDVNRTFRMLLENKVDKAEMSEMDREVNASISKLSQTVDALSCHKVDSQALQSVRDEIALVLQGIRREFETTLDSKLQLAMQRIQSIDSRKLDAERATAIREQYLDALRAALDGLSGSLAALAATKVDRETVKELLAESSRDILRQLKESKRKPVVSREPAATRRTLEKTK